MIITYSYNFIFLNLNGDKKDVLNFCNAAIFCDQKNIIIFQELNQARRCIYNNFHETIPVSRILITLSNIDVVVFEINDNDIQNVIENIHDPRENILCMLSFEKVIREEEAN